MVQEITCVFVTIYQVVRIRMFLFIHSCDCMEDQYVISHLTRVYSRGDGTFFVFLCGQDFDIAHSRCPSKFVNFYHINEIPPV